MYSSSRAGPLYGLRMVMRTDQDTYLPWTEASGVIIDIHMQDEIPYPGELPNCIRSVFLILFQMYSVTLHRRELLPLLVLVMFKLLVLVNLTVAAQPKQN